VKFVKSVVQETAALRMKVGIKDSQIAATALTHQLTVVTRNTDHFPGLQTLNPFSE